MIGYIRGIFVDEDESAMLIENQGIGYRIFVPDTMYRENISKGEEIKIYTYLHVKEDALQLYGFPAKDDLNMFRLLIGVNGIGPKAGLGILSALSADELRLAVLSDDIKTLSKAPGIGKKTAQKLILELKDKMHLEDVLENTGKDANAGLALQGNQQSAKEAVQALVALGYPNAEALRAVGKVKDASTMEVEEILKAALKFII